MKIKNSRAVNRVPGISPARFNAIMAERVGSQFLSFDDIREAEGKTAEELTDGAIHQAATDAGIVVEF